MNIFLRLKIFAITILVLAFPIGFMLQSVPVAAQGSGPDTSFKWDGNISITNNSSSGDLVGVISRIILWLLGILALVAAIIIIYAGILLVFNGGNEKRVTQAKSTLLWAIIGLVVSIGAFALVNIIQQVLG